MDWRFVSSWVGGVSKGEKREQKKWGIPFYTIPPPQSDLCLDTRKFPHMFTEGYVPRGFPGANALKKCCEVEALRRSAVQGFPLPPVGRHQTTRSFQQNPKDRRKFRILQPFSCTLFSRMSHDRMILDGKFPSSLCATCEGM